MLLSSLSLLILVFVSQIIIFSFSLFLFLFLGTVPPLSLPALPHGYSPSHVRCLHIFFLIT